MLEMTPDYVICFVLPQSIIVNFDIFYFGPSNRTQNWVVIRTPKHSRGKILELFLYEDIRWNKTKSAVATLWAETNMLQQNTATMVETSTWRGLSMHTEGEAASFVLWIWVPLEVRLTLASVKRRYWLCLIYEAWLLREEQCPWIPLGCLSLHNDAAFLEI